MATNADRFGRFVIPKRIRDGMNLRADAAVKVEVDGDRVVLLPAHKGPVLKKKGLVWVLCGGDAEEDLRTAVERLRAERDVQVLGLRPR